MTYGYSDVLDDGRLAVASYRQPFVSFGGATVGVPDWLMYLRTVLSQGLAYAIGQGNNTGRAWLVDEFGRSWDLGLTYGVSPVALVDSAAFGFRAVIQRSGTSADILQLSPGGGTLVRTVTFPLTSQGFLDAELDGTPILTDPVQRVIDGQAVAFPCTRGAVTIAQGHEGGTVMLKDGVIGTLAQGDCFEPHQSPNGKFWCCRSASPNVLSGPVPDVVPIVIAPPIVVPAVPALNHPVSIAPFKDPNQELKSDSEVVVNGALPDDWDKPVTPDLAGTRRRWIAADQASLTAFRRGVDHGLYDETFDPDELRRVVGVAAALRTRVAFCHDGTDLDRLMLQHLRPDVDHVWLECYRTKTETLEESITRWSVNLDTLLDVWSGAIGLIPQDYTQGGVGPDELWTVQEALDACGPVPAMANRSSRIVTIAPFEYLRGNGATAHPEFVVWLNRLIAASPGVPVFAPIESPSPVPPADPSDPIAPTPTPAPTPVPEPEPIGGSVKLPAGNYAVSYDATGTLTFTAIASSGGSAAPAYPDYHAALVEIRSARAAKGQGPNDDIDAYRLLVEHPMDVDAVKAAI